MQACFQISLVGPVEDREAGMHATLKQRGSQSVRVSDCSVQQTFNHANLYLRRTGWCICSWLTIRQRDVLFLYAKLSQGLRGQPS